MVDQQQIQQWIKDLQSKNLSRQRKAAYNLAQYGDETVIRPILLARNFDSEEHGGIVDFDRSNPIEIIAQRLGTTALKSLVDILAEGIDGPLLGFQAYSIERGLITIGKSAVEPVIELLKHPISYVRYSATIILGEIGDTRAVTPLMETLKTQLSFEAVEALSRLGAEGIAAIFELWKSENQSSRFYIVRALSQLKSSQQRDDLVQLLIDALQDSYWLVKMNAIVALGYFGNVQTVDLLIPFLNDQAYQHPAAQALEKLGTPKALQAVETWRLTKSQKS